MRFCNVMVAERKKLELTCTGRAEPGQSTVRTHQSYRVTLSVLILRNAQVASDSLAK